MGHQWTKNYVNYGGHHVEPIDMFLSGSRGTGKSYFKVINNTIVYHCKDLEKPRVLILGPTGILAVNTVQSVIHSGIGTKPGTKQLGLNDKSRSALSNSSRRWKFLIVN